jgi:hypothetical protein
LPAAARSAPAMPATCPVPEQPQTGSITGTIRTLNDEPFLGEFAGFSDAVRLFKQGAGSPTLNYPNLSGSGNVLTYSVSGIQPGRYKVLFLNPRRNPGSTRYASQWFASANAIEDATEIEVAAGVTLTNISAVLSPGSIITGHLTFDGPLPTANPPFSAGSVTLLTSSGVELDRTWIDDNGIYSFARGYPAGGYKVRFSAQGYRTQFYGGASRLEEALVITTNGLIASADINAAMTRPESGIVGRLTRLSDGSGLPNTAVTAVTSDTLLLPSEQALGTTDATGYYTIPVASGYYTVAPFTAQREAFVSQRAQVTVTNGVSAVVNFALAPGATLRGRYIDAQTRSAVTGNVFEYVLDATTGASVDLTPLYGSRDLSGRFSLYSFPPGNYKIRLVADGYHDSFINGKYALGNADVISVAGTGIVELGDVLLVPCTQALPTPGPTFTPVRTQRRVLLPVIVR